MKNLFKSSGLGRNLSAAEVDANFTLVKAAVDKAATQVAVTPTGNNTATLSNWQKAFATSPTTARMAIVGDSTADFTGGPAIVIKPYLVSAHTQAGQALAGFDVAANLPNFGQNGQTLAGYLSQTGPATTGGRALADLVAWNPHLITFGYGINDVRVNTDTKAGMLATLRPMLRKAVEDIRAALPHTDIVLVQPTALLSVSPNNYINKGAYATIAEAAQAKSEVLYELYEELRGEWPNVSVLSLQDDVYGRLAVPSSPLMADELHRAEEPFIDALVKLIGNPIPLHTALARRANEQNLSAPWTIYPRAVEDNAYFYPIASDMVLSVNGQGSNYFDVGTVSAAKLSGLARTGDILLAGGQLVFAINNAAISTPTVMRITGVTVPANNLLVGAKVQLFRSKYGLVEAARPYFDNVRDFPYRRHVSLTYAGANIFTWNTSLDDGIVTRATPFINPAQYQITTSDVMVFPDGRVVPLTGATITPNTNFGMRVDLPGVDFSAYVNGHAFVFGNHPYEDDASLLTGTVTGLQTTVAAVSAKTDALVQFVRKPPMTALVNDDGDTLSWTDTGGNTWEEAEYTLDGGTTWANTLGNPQPIGNIDKAIGLVGVRYRAANGLPATAAVYNQSAFTHTDRPTVQVMTFGGKTAGTTQNAGTGDVAFANGGDAGYGALYLSNNPGNYITWQFAADANLGYVNVGFDHTKNLNFGGYGPFSDGRIPVVPNGYARIAVAPNGHDFLMQSSTDNVTYTTLYTVENYAAYYSSSDYFPLCIKVLANGTSAIKGLKGLGLSSKYVQVVADGNSLTSGTNSSTYDAYGGNINGTTRRDYPAQLRYLFSTNHDYNVQASYGVSGQTTTQMAADAATEIDPYINAKWTDNILLAWEITNDFCNAGTSKEQSFDNFKAYCLARKAAGWKVLAGNFIQRTSNLNTRTVQEIAEAQAYCNARFVAEWSTFADGLVDLNALNLQNTAGWDGTHPSDEGYGLVAKAFKAAILTLIPPAYTTPAESNATDTYADDYADGYTATSNDAVSNFTAVAS